MCQWGHIILAFSAPPWWGEINPKGVIVVEMSTKCEKGWKWVKLGENAISPM